VFLHLFTLSNMLAMVISLFLTWRTDPGILSSPRDLLKNNNNKSSNSINTRRARLGGAGTQKDTPQEMRDLSRQLHAQYDDALEQYANPTTTGSPNNSTPSVPPNLCHTCHIVKPLRSKHCRVQRKCVLLFDHYCPFVGTSIGAYNYKYFYVFLMSMSASLVGFVSTFVQYMMRAPTFDLLTFTAGVYLTIWLVPAMGMLLYHTDLMTKNLTTNEHQNVGRYAYLRGHGGSGNSHGGSHVYQNPFDMGWSDNIYSRLFPTAKSYQLPPPPQQFPSSSNNPHAHAHGGGCCTNHESHQHSHAHQHQHGHNHGRNHGHNHRPGADNAV
jgi:hypothetical protein